MGIFDFFKKPSPQEVAHSLPEDVLRVEMVSRQTSNGHSTKIVNEAKSLRAQSLKDWKNAISSATDPEEPDTTALHELYDSLLLDAHLAGAIESRMLKVQRSKFQIIDKDGKEVEELTQLLKRPFFADFIEAAMWTKFRGAQLLELMELNPITLELVKGFRFPEQHVNFKKRFIMKEVGDSTGFAFEGGAIDRFYLCFGEPRKLGLLADIAQVVILKKAAVAAWAEFTERFGVPPRVGKVRPGDDQRAKEMANMLENMVSSTWAVLEKDEEFEIANIKQADAHQTFDRLIDRCNSEISKRVLGASGTTDEKAHVGAANVHYEIANDRYMSDKAMVEYLVNQELIPRLVQISSVYAPLANHHFRWDEMEDLKPLEYGELIASLSLNFELDLEEVSEKTGMKVLGHKYVNGNEGGSDPDKLENPNPKKKSLNAKVAAFYQGALSGCGYKLATVLMASINLGDYEALINRLIGELSSKKIKPTDLDRELIEKTFTDIRNGGEKDSPGFLHLEPDHPYYKKSTQINNNLFVFSAAKSLAQLEFINNKLVADDGKFKSFDDFKKAIANKVNTSYNKNWLKTEYNTARSSVYHARKWSEYQDTKHLYPNLKYVAVNDSLTRDKHRSLHGTIMPIDDPFWNNFYPPNGWNCRCDVQPTKSGATQPPNDTPELANQFKKNVGKQGIIFTKNHPYFEFEKGDEKKREEVVINIAKAVARIPNEMRYKSKSGGFITVHPLDNAGDLKKNYQASSVLADNGHAVELKIQLANQKNPDARIDGQKADFKSPSSYNAVKTRIKDANQQGVTIAIIDLGRLKNWEAQNVFDAIKGACNPNRNKGIKEIWVIDNNKSFERTRAEWWSEVTPSDLETLKP